MKIDWKRKLTSRKFWAAVVGFVTMLMVYFGEDAGTTEQVAALIMAGASLLAYIVGEGLTDAAQKNLIYNLPLLEDDEEEDADDGA